MRWHDPHASPLFTPPSVMTRGAVGWSFGNQSGGAFRSSICGLVYFLPLPSIVNCPSSFSGSGGLLTTMAAVGNAHPRSFPAGAWPTKMAAETTTKSIPIQFFMGASTEDSNFRRGDSASSFCYPCLRLLIYIARQEHERLRMQAR